MSAAVLARRLARPRSGRPDLLLVSPVLPDDRGNGLAMRAALFLHALARRFDVHLLLVPISGGLADRGPWPAVTDACVEIVVPSPVEDPLFRFILTLRDPRHRLAAIRDYPLPALARFATPAAVEAALGALGDRRFAAVHVFRLYMAPFAAPFLGTIPATLDLDDDEPRTVRSMAALAHAYGSPEEAALQEAEAGKLERFEADWAGRFSTICYAAPDDAARVSARLPNVAAACIPNAVVLPPPVPPPPASGPFTLLFVGSMGYPPNHDAALFLARDVLPRLRRRTTVPVRLVLAGSHPGPSLLALQSPPEIEVTGWVDDLGPLYAACHAVVAPLRAGGGTRIKILEAFAHGRPVVATKLAAEGIDAKDGRHLLIGETADDLALAINRLIESPDLAAALTAEARELVAHSYEREVVAGRIERLFP